MFRKFFLTFCFLFLFLPVYSLGGVLADSSSPLHVIRTEFFDIIFPSSPTANPVYDEFSYKLKTSFIIPLFLQNQKKW